MINFVNRYVPSPLRFVLAPITMRFIKTDDLINTMSLLDMCDNDKLDADTAKFAHRTQMRIAKELVRRNVRFWEQL